MPLTLRSIDKEIKTLQKELRALRRLRRVVKRALPLVLAKGSLGPGASRQARGKAGPSTRLGVGQRTKKQRQGRRPKGGHKPPVGALEKRIQRLRPGSLSHKLFFHLKDSGKALSLKRLAQELSKGKVDPGFIKKVSQAAGFLYRRGLLVQTATGGYRAAKRLLKPTRRKGGRRHRPGPAPKKLSRLELAVARLRKGTLAYTLYHHIQAEKKPVSGEDLIKEFILATEPNAKRIATLKLGKTFWKLIYRGLILRDGPNAWKASEKLFPGPTRSLEKSMWISLGENPEVNKSLDQRILDIIKSFNQQGREEVTPEIIMAALKEQSNGSTPRPQAVAQALGRLRGRGKLPTMLLPKFNSKK